MKMNLKVSPELREKQKKALENIKKLYLADERPWVVGYSGGKDSTATVQAIFYGLLGIPKEKRLKKIYIISTDTFIENPMIMDYIEENIQKIKDSAKKLDLPIEMHKLQPHVSDTFWVNLIGRGYPAPIQTFRWCTDRLKIKPSNTFIRGKVDEHGEIIMVLGIRKGESSSRDIVIKNRSVEGKLLKTHGSLPNAYVFAPIEEFTTDDVWEFLVSNYQTPWGSDNKELLKLYEDSTEDGECPLMVDKDMPSCGNSRFGCWACTVVKEDKSLTGFLKTAKRNKRAGKDVEINKEIIVKLESLLKFRNSLCENRNKEECREKKRQNGTVYYINRKDKDGNVTKQIGLGAYTFETRQKMLKDLLILQKKVGVNLIKKEEILEIRKEWKTRLGDFSDTVSKIYFEVTGERLVSDLDERPFMDKMDVECLKNLSEEEGISSEVLLKLLALESEHYGYKYRAGIYKKIDSILNQDWLHQEFENEDGY
ncbi:DNA phosphorothioation system sulfurtransferase DndC [Methanococcus maripaludis]|uniref:DNA sulfur modification protein DndC n=1 Tax=Methanococcus maripaludis TaxID=39152 RepID=A0A7J9PN50_METMI|nr:DNA phosphorothioation system sulfurtransferase DndC [Methanococcus maripaludis]MBA2864037.1 DNA sulfur modification protein DndC [Methanococcus maripaludis]